MPLASFADQIKDYIAANKLKPGERLPSERALALALGTSQASINRALHFLIGNGQLRRKGYKLFVAGSAECEKPLRLRAFIGEEAHQSIARKTAQLLGCELTTPASQEENVVRKALLDLKPTDADGLLLTGGHHHDLLHTLSESGLPVVLCGTSSSVFSSVSVDQSRIGSLAVEHLAGLGHRNIALLQLITRSIHALAWSVVGEGYLHACLRLGLAESSKRIAPIYNDTLADAAAAWAFLHPRESGITAVVCPHQRIAQHIVALARKDGLKVPGDFSVIVLQETDSAAANQPPLTAVSGEWGTLIRHGVFLLHQLASQPGSRRHPPPNKIAVDPVLIIRASTASPPGHQTASPPPPIMVTNPAAPGSWPMINIWATDARQRIMQAQKLNQTPFINRPAVGEHHIPLDLSKLANRSCSREHSWLGEQPLRHLPTGNVSLHGVPFHLLDEAQNNNRNAIVLRSERAHSSFGAPLPLSVTVPIDQKVTALYILHGAGWTDHHRPFAEYVFRYDGGGLERVSVIPYANFSSTPLAAEAWREESIIQDWHPMHARFESRQALPCVITEGGDPYNYERYLYVWQWINPHPERRLRSLSLRMLDPTSRATIGMLAITLQCKQA